MTLTMCQELEVFNWIAHSDTPLWQLIYFGPRGFAASARLRFIPDPTGPGQAEADADVGEAHPPDIAQMQRALRLLAGSTEPSMDWYFCVWDGYGEITRPTNSAPRYVAVPHRRYALLQGDLSDVDTWSEQLGHEVDFPPAFAWPADQSCCFASDVDPHWAGIGGSQDAIDRLVRDEILDVVPVDPEADQPVYW